MENLAQAFGVAPESGIGKILAAIGPVGGIATGKAVQVLGRALSKSAFMRKAFGQILTEDFIRVTETMGTKLKPSVPASDLYDRLGRLGVKVPPSLMKNTRASLKELREEIDRLAVGVEQKQSIVDAIRGFEEKLAPRGFQPQRPAGFTRELPGFQRPAPIDFATIQTNRRAIGTEIARFESQALGGTKLGQSKKLFSAIERDLNAIASRGGMGNVATKLLRKANKTFAREKSIQELDEIGFKFVKEGPEGFLVLDADGAANAIRSLTDPRSPGFNKNFQASLGEEAGEIKAFFTEAQAILKKFAGSGAGELQVRQRFSKMGAAIGAGAGSPFGVTAAGVGAFIGGTLGVKGPELLTKGLLTSLGRKYLLAHMRATEGALSNRAIAVAAFLGQSGMKMTERGIEALVKEVINPFAAKFIEGGREAVRQVREEAVRQPSAR
jgi:hypothetical protein